MAGRRRRPRSVQAAELAAALTLLLGSVGAATGNAALAQNTPRRSGYEFMSPSTQALQNDDTQNPAFLWVKGGQEHYQRHCSRCHGAVDAAGPLSLRGVALRYPAFDAALNKPLTLSGRIQQCRERHLLLPALAPEHEDLLGLEAFVALQSRGQTVPEVADPRLAPALERGAQLWQTRLGQLGLSCAQCHDHQAGQRLAGNLIPQGHATGYPLYRLEWQSLGSLQRRLRNCMTGVRAAPFDYGSDELTALELHLKKRATGMRLEAPAVRP